MKMSKMQATIKYQNTHWTIEDQGSTNGTWLYCYRRDIVDGSSDGVEINVDSLVYYNQDQFIFQQDFC